jgi:hypothetical protein
MGANELREAKVVFSHLLDLASSSRRYKLRMRVRLFELLDAISAAEEERERLMQGLEELGAQSADMLRRLERLEADREQAREGLQP